MFYDSEPLSLLPLKLILIVCLYPFCSKAKMLDLIRFCLSFPLPHLPCLSLDQLALATIFNIHEGFSAFG